MLEAARNAAELFRAAEEAQSEEEREAMEERREEMEEAMREAEEAHEEAMQEMDEAMREMDVEIGEAVEEAMAEVDMDEINEAIQEAMEGFGEAMAEMGEALGEAFEDMEFTGHEHENGEHSPSVGTISGSINGVAIDSSIAETIADALRAVEEQFNSEAFAEQVEQTALEGVTSAFEEMAYEKDSIKVINDNEEKWRDPLDVLAELPAEYAVPALERVAENHEDAARREKAARLAGKLAAEAETSENGQ